jgi:hypothetical protein
MKGSEGNCGGSAVTVEECRWKAEAACSKDPDCDAFAVRLHTQAEAIYGEGYFTWSGQSCLDEEMYKDTSNADWNFYRKVKLVESCNIDINTKYSTVKCAFSAMKTTCCDALDIYMTCILRDPISSWDMQKCQQDLKARRDLPSIDCPPALSKIMTVDDDQNNQYCHEEPRLTEMSLASNMVQMVKASNKETELPWMSIRVGFLGGLAVMGLIAYVVHKRRGTPQEDFQPLVA